jgi:hypothetical protein
MALGKIPTYGLRRDKKKNEQKDAGSTGQTWSLAFVRWSEG